MARPSTYEPKTVAAILGDVSAGSSIEAACQCAGIRRTTFLSQVKRHGLADRLALAKARKLVAGAEHTLAAASGKKRKSHRAPKSRPEGPLPAPHILGQPEVTGACLWSANDAALAVIVSIAGAVVDELREEFRLRGTPV